MGGDCVEEAFSVTYDRVHRKISEFIDIEGGRERETRKNRVGVFVCNVCYAVCKNMLTVNTYTHYWFNAIVLSVGLLTLILLLLA